MALEGNARDFGLSEILQLVALQKKTGMLSITGEREMVIYFREGLIVSTRDRRRLVPDPLREYMLRYGIMSPEEMARIDRVQSETSLDLTDILLSEKKFSEDELREIFAEQIQESLQEVLAWPKSQYKFVIGSQVLQGVRSFGGYKVEGLLMESMRRIDEMPELLRIFPSEETLVRRVPMGAERPELEPAEQELYELLESETSLAALLPRARMARFCAYETLKQLLEKGLLQVTPVERPVPAAEEETEEEYEVVRPSRTVPLLAAAGALAACFVIGEIAVPRLLPPGWSFASRASARIASAPRGASLAPDLAGIEAGLVERSVRDALEEHLALAGVYPGDLGTLVSKGLRPRATIERAAALGLTYRMERGGTAYSLDRGRP